MAKIVKNYVSLIRVETVRKTVDRQIKMYRSPALLKEKDAKNWITHELEKYPNAQVNQYNVTVLGVNVFTSIIAFDPKESENWEQFFKRCDIPLI